jgi:predicted nuclease of predicted toxin-antitoxin system
LSEYPESVAARDVGLSRAPDAKLWSFAQTNQFVVVTKDSDFIQRSFLFGAPPKVIWIAAGNCSTKQIVNLLRNSTERILKFEFDPTAALLILS